MSPPEPTAQPAQPAPRSTAIAPAARSLRRRLVRRRFWLALLLASLVCLPLYPPAWHAALRTWLGWQARRHGCDLTIAGIEGGIFDATQLYGLRCRQHGLPSRVDSTSEGTDVFITRADLTLAWTVPWLQRPAPSWVRSLVLDGVRGRWDLRPRGRPRALPPSTASGVERGGFALATISGDVFGRALGALFPSLGGFSQRLIPESFLIRAEDFRLDRGRYHLSTVRLWLSGSRDDAGQFLARELRIAGPGFENALLSPHGQTYWKGSRLTLMPLALAPDVTLVSATLDGTHLDNHRLDWEGKLSALGGEARGQGTVDFSGERLRLEVAASLQSAQLRPLVRLLGVTGPADGLVDQGNFTFRGDPENWPAAQMWLAAHATDFRWDKRHWQDLELQAVVVNRRVQINRLELRQSRNRVSLTGECPLPPAPVEDRSAADALRQWREGGFSCQVDARLDDLRSLADLFGPELPALDGRMSINGKLNGLSGPRQDIDGYLNVEGSSLTLRGAPLDFLRSTLLFRDGELRVADLQATHDRDYFTGTGSMRLDGPPRYGGDLRAEIGKLAAYTPVLAGLPLAEELARVTSLTAGLRWEDSVLHFDEFRGKFDGAFCQVGGTVDLHDAARPALDLALDGENVTVHETGGGGQVKADCALTLRSEAGGLPTFGGHVRLLGGRLDRTLEIGPYSAGTGDFLSCGRWLPEECRLCALDIRVTAVAALQLASGEVTPELHICPTPMPGLSAGPGIAPWYDDGKLEFRDTRVRTPDRDLSDAHGTVYLPFGINGSVETSLLATGPNGERVALFGHWNLVETASIGGETTVRAHVDTGVGDWSSLHPPSLPLLWMANETPWPEFISPPPLAPPAPPPGAVLTLR